MRRIKSKKKDQANPGEKSCPPGYVVLDKPNKYGAFCEPKEGLPKPEGEKCKFNMIGTPPNCRCPDGKEFIGYKGCVKVETKERCVVFSYGLKHDQRNRLDQEWLAIRSSCPKDGQASCAGGISQTTVSRCCCTYKVYD